MESFMGTGCSDGVALARVYRKPPEAAGGSRKAGSPAEEAQRLETAIAELLAEMEARHAETLQQGEAAEAEAELYESYLMILQDEVFFGDVKRYIAEAALAAEAALEKVRTETEAVFMAMDDEYMKERFLDISSVCGALSAELAGGDTMRGLTLTEDTVVVADMLTPLHTIHLDKAYLKGFVTRDGGPTSHAVILAKTLGIPAIVGAGAAYAACQTGQQIAMDGHSGEVVLAPDAATREAFLQLRLKLEKQRALIAAEPKGEAFTTDGRRIMVAVNTGDDDSASLIDPESCDGVGLLRTEFLYMQHADYPDEETQYQAYRAVAQRLQDKEVIVRTLDIGGDKQLDYFDIPPEENPFLGFRALRICLARPQLFKTQLRAILRASAHGRVKIMFPMVVTLEELRQAKALVAESMAELKAEGKAFDENMATGIMVETPAAALLAPELAAEADFFSIGTNDLIQYVTAADRANTGVGYLYTNANLSVLRAIRLTGQAAGGAGIPLGVCGEMASADEMIPFLIGCGVEELSVSAGSLDKVRYIVRRVSYAECQKLAKQVCACGEQAAARQLLQSAVPKME